MLNLELFTFFELSYTSVVAKNDSCHKMGMVSDVVGPINMKWVERLKAAVRDT